MTFHLLEVKLLHFKCQYVFVNGTQMSFEQRANIKFCFKIGKTFTETFQLKYREDGSWRLLHDNAPSHRSTLVADIQII